MEEFKIGNLVWKKTSINTGIYANEDCPAKQRLLADGFKLDAVPFEDTNFEDIEIYTSKNAIVVLDTIDSNYFQYDLADDEFFDSYSSDWCDVLRYIVVHIKSRSAGKTVRSIIVTAEGDYTDLKFVSSCTVNDQIDITCFSWDKSNSYAICTASDENRFYIADWNFDRITEITDASEPVLYHSITDDECYCRYTRKDRATGKKYVCIYKCSSDKTIIQVENTENNVKIVDPETVNGHLVVFDGEKYYSEFGEFKELSEMNF